MSDFLTHDEALAVAQSWNWLLPTPRTADTEGLRRKGSIDKLPASQLLGFVRSLTSWTSAERRDETLLVIFEYGIWSEHRPLEQTIRNALVSAETVESKPALRVDVGDLDYLVSYIFVCLTFGWGLSLVCRTGSRWAVVDHDGMVWIGSAVAEEARIAQETWLDG